MENKVYFIGSKCSVAELAEKVSLVNVIPGEEEIAYMGFWDDVYIIEYDGNTGIYTVKDNIFGDYGFHFCYDVTEFVQYCNYHDIQFSMGILGQPYASYAMAHLALVRWAADVVWTRELYNNLLEE